MKGFMNVFKKAVLPLLEEERVNTQDLDESLNLLRMTTLEVSAAAVSAAESLQNKIKEVEFRFFSTIDAVKDIIMIKDDANNWKTLNIEAQRVFGIPMEDWIGKSAAEVGEKYPFMKESLTRCSQLDETTWISKQPTRITETILINGVERIFDLVKTPLYHEDGSRRELIIIGRDITEIKNTDKRMNACFAALNYASDSIAILDSSYKIVFSNDSFNESFGIHNDIHGQHLMKVIPMFPKYFTMVKSLVCNKPWKGKFEDYSINVMPVMNGSPTPVHFICTFKKNKHHFS